MILAGATTNRSKAQYQSPVSSKRTLKRADLLRSCGEPKKIRFAILFEDTFSKKSSDDCSVEK